MAISLADANRTRRLLLRTRISLWDSPLVRTEIGCVAYSDLHTIVRRASFCSPNACYMCWTTPFIAEDWNKTWK